MSDTSAALLHQPLIQPVSRRAAGLVETEGGVCTAQMCRGSSGMHTQKNVFVFVLFKNLSSPFLLIFDLGK